MYRAMVIQYPQGAEDSEEDAALEPQDAALEGPTDADSVLAATRPVRRPPEHRAPNFHPKTNVMCSVVNRTT
jgi:hypothetical protein